MHRTAFPNFARVQIETLCPLSISNGQSSDLFNFGLVCDANGLPAIPGTTIAGVLRHLYADIWPQEVGEVFGFQNADDTSHDTKGQVSRVSTSWGCMQNHRGQAIQGLCHDDTALRSDPILNAALEMAEIPEYRDRVAIDHRGVADNKFNRSVLPKGYRFTFEITYWSDGPDDEKWVQLLSLLRHPLFGWAAIREGG